MTRSFSRVGLAVAIALSLMGCSDIQDLDTDQVGAFAPCDDRLIEAETLYEYGLSLTSDGQTPTWNQALIMFRWIEVNSQTVDGFDGYTFRIENIRPGVTIKNFFLYEVTHDTPCSQLPGFSEDDTHYCEQDLYQTPISDKIPFVPGVVSYTFKTVQKPRISSVAGKTNANYVAVAAEVELDASMEKPQKYFAEMNIGEYHAQLSCKLTGVARKKQSQVEHFSLPGFLHT